jgi:hypothetical protein
MLSMAALNWRSDWATAERRQPRLRQILHGGRAARREGQPVAGIGEPQAGLLDRIEGDQGGNGIAGQGAQQVARLAGERDGNAEQGQRHQQDGDIAGEDLAANAEIPNDGKPHHASPGRRRQGIAGPCPFVPEKTKKLVNVRRALPEPGGSGDPGGRRHWRGEPGTDTLMLGTNASCGESRAG